MRVNKNSQNGDDDSKVYTIQVHGNEIRRGGNGSQLDNGNEFQTSMLIQISWYEQNNHHN